MNYRIACITRQCNIDWRSLKITSWQLVGLNYKGVKFFLDKNIFPKKFWKVKNQFSQGFLYEEKIRDNWGLF